MLCARANRDGRTYARLGTAPAVTRATGAGWYEQVPSFSAAYRPNREEQKNPNPSVAASPRYRRCGFDASALADLGRFAAEKKAEASGGNARCS